MIIRLTPGTKPNDIPYICARVFSGGAVFRTSTRVYAFCSTNYAGGVYRLVELSAGQRFEDSAAGAAPAGSGPAVPPDSITTLDMSPSGAPGQIITTPGAVQLPADVLDAVTAATSSSPAQQQASAGAETAASSNSSASSGTKSSSNSMLVPAVAVAGTVAVAAAVAGAAIVAYRRRQRMQQANRVMPFNDTAIGGSASNLPAVVRGGSVMMAERGTQHRMVAWANPAFEP